MNYWWQVNSSKFIVRGIGAIWISMGTLSVTYRWKVYHIGFQKIYVGGSENVTGKSYCAP